MPLTGPQIGRIHQALLAAYDRAEFTRVVFTCLNVDFDNVVAPDDFAAQLFELVRWADRQKRIPELVRCVHEDRPNDAELAALAAEVQGWAAAPAPGPAAPPAAEPAPAPPVRRGGWIVAALGAVAVLAVALLAWQPWKPVPPAAPGTLAAAPESSTAAAPAAAPAATATATATPSPANVAGVVSDPALLVLMGQIMATAAAAQATMAAAPGATPDATVAAVAAEILAGATATPSPTVTPSGRPPANGAGLTAKLWRPGQTLRIRFLGGDPDVQERIAAIAQEWTQYANLTFAFGEDPDAEIRVGFEPTGSWSFIGTDALSIPRDQQTMNFGWLEADTDEESFRQVVLREFGHMIGVINEQQNPNADIPWDEAAVIAYYNEQFGWSEEQVRSQVLGHYPPAELAVPKPFDPESVMMLPVSNDLTVGDYAIAGNNAELSALDKRSVATIYSRVNGAGLKANLWEPGQTLRIRFLDGDPEVQQRVAEVAQEWTQYANLTFEFGDDPDADIRISFLQGSTWSYIGAQAKTVPADQPTMNFGWLTDMSDEEEYRRVVLAGFGRALGMIHEHQQPNADIPWDEAAVIRFYSGPPNYWSDEQISRNIFDEYSPADLAVPKPFDPLSIMMLPVDGELTISGYEVVGRNTELSGLDKWAVAQLYPHDGAAVPAATATQSPAQVGPAGP